MVVMGGDGFAEVEGYFLLVFKRLADDLADVFVGGVGFEVL